MAGLSHGAKGLVILLPGFFNHDMPGKKTLFANADLVLTLAGAAAKDGRRVTEADLGFMAKTSILVEDGRIAWIGPHRKTPRGLGRVHEVSMKGRTILPGFVECHTHSVFAGHRADEFEWRNRGASYQEIAAKGGGILSTVRRTRAASLAQLIKTTQASADDFAGQGVTTLEIKSGYALNAAGEVKMLKAAGAVCGPRILRTFLGAHALPPEFKSYDKYLEFLAQEVLPVVRRRKLAERVDVFIENGFFPREASAKYLRRAQELGFEITIHADQLSLSGGTATAVALDARSADHVIRLDAAGIENMARSRTTAVLLPAADLYLRCPYPPARALIDAGARVALATDFNPGTSPTRDLNLVGLLARLEMKMTLPEVIAAYTVGAAHALGLAEESGSLEVGKRADLLSTSEGWEVLFYAAGSRLVERTFVEGREIFTKPS